MIKQGIHVYMTLIECCTHPDGTVAYEGRPAHNEYRVVGVDRKATLEAILSRMSVGLAALARKKLGVVVEGVTSAHHIEVSDRRDHTWITVTPCDLAV